MFKTLSLCVLGFAAVQAADEANNKGLDWKEWEWETSFFGLLDELPFKDQYEFYFDGDFVTNGEVDWFNGRYLTYGQFQWTTDYESGQVDTAVGQTYQKYAFLPLDVGVNGIATFEFAKWYYHTLNAYVQAAEVKALEVTLMWPKDWRDWWDADHSTGTTADDFTFGWEMNFAYNKYELTQLSNFRRCKGDLLGFIKSDGEDEGKIGYWILQYRR